MTLQQEHENNVEIEWQCPECDQVGTYHELRNPIDLGVDQCPGCSTEVEPIQHSANEQAQRRLNQQSVINEVGKL